jgi:hypothetical protein
MAGGGAAVLLLLLLAFLMTAAVQGHGRQGLLAAGGRCLAAAGRLLLARGVGGAARLRGGLRRRWHLPAALAASWAAPLVALLPDWRLVIGVTLEPGLGDRVVVGGQRLVLDALRLSGAGAATARR